MIKKKFMKYAVMVVAVSCCLLFADKSTSSANAGKNNVIGANEPSVYEEAACNDKVVNGYPKVKYKYEVDDNGDITLSPFLQYSHINENGDIEWSEPVKDIDKVKEYFNEEMIAIMSEGGKYKVDTSMIEE